MSKLLKKNPIVEDNSFYISQQKTSIDSLIATHTAIPTAHQDLDAFNAIGVANKQWISPIYEGGTAGAVQNESLQWVSGIIRNFGAEDNIGHFVVPLSPNKGSYSLKLDTLKMDITIADATDYLNNIYIYGVQQDGSAPDQLYANAGGGWNSAQTINLDLSDIDCTGYLRIVLRLDFVFTTANQFTCLGPSFEYYYS